MIYKNILITCIFKCIPSVCTVNFRYNEVLGTCKFIRYKRIIINAFSALGKNLHFVISGYFVISSLVITGVYCIKVIFFRLIKNCIPRCTSRTHETPILKF